MSAQKKKRKRPLNTEYVTLVQENTPVTSLYIIRKNRRKKVFSLL